MTPPAACSAAWPSLTSTGPTPMAMLPVTPPITLRKFLRFMTSICLLAVSRLQRPRILSMRTEMSLSPSGLPAPPCSAMIQPV